MPKLMLIILLTISGLPIIKAGLGEIFEIPPIIVTEEPIFVRTYPDPPITLPKPSKWNCPAVLCSSTSTSTPMKSTARPVATTTSFTTPSATITSFTTPSATNSTCDATDTACNYCAIAVSQFDYCQSIADSLDGDDSYILDCLCYENDSNTDLEWAPNYFDSAFASCPAYASTADSADVTLIQSLTSLCHTVGNYFMVNTTDSGSFNYAQAPSTTGSAGGSTPTPGSSSSASAPMQTSGSRSEYQFTGLLPFMLTATLLSAVSIL